MAVSWTILALAASTVSIPAATAATAVTPQHREAVTPARNHASTGRGVVSHFSTAAARHVTKDEDLTYIAGYQSTPRKGVTSATTTVKIPALTCTNPDPEGTALGIGSENAIGTPAFLGDVIAACDGVGRPVYAIEAQVCLAGSSDQGVQVGDIVKINVVGDGAVMTITTQDVTNGHVVSAQGDPTTCGGIPKGSRVSSLTTGSFPLFVAGTFDPLRVAQPVATGKSKCLCYTLEGSAIRPFKPVVRDDGYVFIEPIESSKKHITLHITTPVPPPSCDYSQLTGTLWGETDSYRAHGGVNSYVSDAADDFSVTHRCTVTTVKVLSDGARDPAFITVTFFADDPANPGFPSPYPLYTESVSGYTNGYYGGLPSNDMPLANPVTFYPGITYWLSVRADLSTVWYWQTTDTPTGFAAVKGNDNTPAGVTPCAYWTPLHVCMNNIPRYWDLMFKLS